jgi:hypothetical protein
MPRHQHVTGDAERKICRYLEWSNPGGTDFIHTFLWEPFFSLFFPLCFSVGVCIFAKDWGAYLYARRSGEDWVSLYCRIKYDYYTNPDDSERWRNNYGQEKTKELKKILSCRFFITNTTWIALGFYPGLSVKLGSLYVINPSLSLSLSLSLYIYMYMYIFFLSLNKFLLFKS